MKRQCLRRAAPVPKCVPSLVTKLIVSAQKVLF